MRADHNRLPDSGSPERIVSAARAGTCSQNSGQSPATCRTSDPAVTNTLSIGISDFCRKDDGIDLFMALMTTKPAERLGAALQTPETLRSIADQLFTFTNFKEPIDGAILLYVHKAVADTRATLTRTAPNPCRWTQHYSVTKW